MHRRVTFIVFHCIVAMIQRRKKIIDDDIQPNRKFNKMKWTNEKNEGEKNKNFKKKKRKKIKYQICIPIFNVADSTRPAHKTTCKHSIRVGSFLLRFFALNIFWQLYLFSFSRFYTHTQPHISIDCRCTYICYVCAACSKQKLSRSIH